MAIADYKINIEDMINRLEAAQHLQDAGEDIAAKSVIIKLAKDILEELK